MSIVSLVRTQPLNKNFIKVFCKINTSDVCFTFIQCASQSCLLGFLGYFIPLICKMFKWRHLDLNGTAVKYKSRMDNSKKTPAFDFR